MIKIYELILISWLALAVIIFFILLKINAPYGKFFTKNIGLALPYKLGWFIQEIISPLSLLFFFLVNNSQHNPVLWFFILLWTIHYIYRSIIFPLRMKKNTSKIPLIIMLSAIFFNLINGFLNGYYFGNLSYYPNDYIYKPNFIIGICIFFFGVIINIKSDNILLKIKDQYNEYKIPNGFLYKYISCPNYLGEILEWLGFYIMTMSLPALTFLIWTISNLLPRALATHRWYNNTFNDYPKRRKAIIPFIL